MSPLLRIRRRPCSTLFPYTTLFRSGRRRRGVDHSCPTRCSALGMKDRKSTRLNSSHLGISYAVFCLKKKNRPAAREAAAQEAVNVQHHPAGAATPAGLSNAARLQTE